REEFLEQLDRVLALPATDANARRRMARVATESWNARLRGVMSVVGHRLTTAGRAAKRVELEGC
ncbi:MAG TPA: hypothetical protein VKD72_33850, partial [Gemmataceae bacterium]|nr:hypothetical protein [Gemmataceae bacterium]